MKNHNSFSSVMAFGLFLLSLILTVILINNYQLGVVREEVVTVYRYPTVLQAEFDDRTLLLFRTERGEIAQESVPESVYYSFYSGEKVVVKLRYVGKKLKGVCLTGDCNVNK